MEIHDWTRVTAGIFHDFHHGWITMLGRALNGGCLPPEYYALAEQTYSEPAPDVLTLDPMLGDNVVSLAKAPPQVRFTATAEVHLYARKRDRIAIHRTSDHRIVAAIEIVSPGNKSSGHTLSSFVDKTVELLEAGIHLLIVDLFPPSQRDPQGIHGAIWTEIEDGAFRLPSDKPFTLVAYSAGPLKQAFIQPVAVGDVLPDMPLFLEPDWYVPVPLASTYQAAWDGVPRFWQDQLASPGR
jgi:hypothetical protein